MSNLMVLIPIFGIVASMIVTVFIVYYVFRTRQRKAELAAEVQSKLIDRFNNAPELIDFLQSPNGKQFVSGVQSANAHFARDRVISGVTRAIIVFALGLAFVVMAFGVDNDFWVPAAILFCLGAGMLIASWVSYRLSQRFGLIDHSEG